MQKSIGTLLREKREELKLNLEDVSAAILIKPAFLEALEQDELDKLPSQTHARGYIRSYADFLKLPSQPLIDQLKKVNAPEGLEISEPAEAIAIRTTQAVEAASEFDPVSTDYRVEPEPGTRSTDDTLPTLPASTAIYQEIGNKIKNQRTALGLSVEDIEKYTHLRAYYLNAMEAGRFNQLPSAVQAKGMITNYARFLDLDTDALLLRYAEGIQAEFNERKATQPIKVKAEKTVIRKAMPIKFILTPDLIIGSLAILALVAFLVWSTSQIITERKRELESNIPGISGILLESTVQTDADHMTQTAVQATNVGLMVTPSANVITATLPISPTITLAPELKGPIQINVVAKSRVFLKVIVDGKQAFLGRTVPGNAYPFSAEKTIELVTGDATGIEVIHNQTPLGLLGQPLEVIDLIFSADGMLTPTPIATNTPTVTPAPTRTIAPTATIRPPTITPYVPKP